MGEYIIRVIAVALICGVITTLTDKKGAATSLIRMLCGIFLALTVLAPITNIRLLDFQSLTEDVSRDGAAAVAIGEEMAAEARRTFIKEQARTYILDKAALLQLELEVEVTLSQEYPYKPESVQIRGSASPYGKTRLASAIEEGLGIRKEDQHWIL